MGVPIVSNELERLEIKLEKIIGISKHEGKVRKMYFIFSVPHMVLLLCFYPCAFERSHSIPTVFESGLAESTVCVFL